MTDHAWTQPLEDHNQLKYRLSPSSHATYLKTVAEHQTVSTICSRCDQHKTTTLAEGRRWFKTHRCGK